MRNSSTKTKPAAKKTRFKITPEIRKAYKRSIEEFDKNPNADPDARPLPPEKWVHAMTRKEFEEQITARKLAKKLTTVRLDADVLDWLKSKGEGHISRVNVILRAAMLADRKR